MSSRAPSLIMGAIIIGLVIASGGGHFVSPALADGDSNQLVLPRLMATIIALEPPGLATIQTRTGAVRQVVRGSGWQVGDLIACEQYEAESGRVVDAGLSEGLVIRPQMSALPCPPQKHVRPSPECQG
jgi:hypothetical protein